MTPHQEALERFKAGLQIEVEKHEATLENVGAAGTSTPYTDTITDC
jgi:hypothetical protein